MKMVVVIPEKQGAHISRFDDMDHRERKNPLLIGMATSIDFNTRILGHSSDRVLGYSDIFFLPTLHIYVMYK